MVTEISKNFEHAFTSELGMDARFGKVLTATKSKPLEANSDRMPSEARTFLKNSLPIQRENRVSASHYLDSSKSGKSANANRQCEFESTIEANSRILMGGSSAMLDSELLELVLKDIPSVINAPMLAKRLLREFGELNGVLAASKYRIKKVPGANIEVYVRLNVLKAISLRLAHSKIQNRKVISCWRDLINYCRISMSHQEREKFRVFYLDKKNVLIADEEQSEGTVDHVPVYPRELAKRALELNASALILVHNHPSGDPKPSSEDIQVTQQVVNACQTIGVTVHDHVIIGNGTETSFKASGYL
ncbi:DNA repair protein RadC [Roseovarius sp. CAU 1744]|uniref:RadC family protein n=1 Tax=Roseovarius sp. CAU 1744 TaxID=3140368 RepID=UPI00325BDC08